MSKTSPQKRAADKAEDKQRSILAAARKVFAASGYDKMRMSAVAKAAGVAEGTVYFYFESKNDLIRAVLAEYWAGLTAGARRAAGQERGTLDRLAALARFHMSELLARYEFAVLTVSLRGAEATGVDFTDQIKGYVRVFDDIITTGQERGEVRADITLWAARDMFYGHLDYSARTLLTRGEVNIDPIIDNVIDVFSRAYGAQPALPTRAQSKPSKHSEAERLERVIARIEALVNNHS